ncbi:heme-binding protein [Novosphingobium album (ex Liu et al. 2023)]|uniref:Heme-binding protein n=1 Tax=Novosphingobium album (ex Liu et al. 2023) TaxID=3031130 RepID=A0ABT5WP56_9SPHN|nr:heme-binding protein [Novosphingobium album (ex Liu et al. 2023)]MDE8651659.1 heme-binding protein [Novosphingobium album (ex Liu et al. 2023)]
MGRPVRSLGTAALLLVAACGGGDGGTGGGGGSTPGPTPAPGPAGVPGTAIEEYAAPTQLALSATDTGRIVAQAAAQARQAGHPATIAVVDRVGNVLAVFRMTGAPGTVKIPDAPNRQNVDVQGLDVPSQAAAIAKAITGAYLSSAGNAFTTRTASQIVQPHFPPAPSTVGLESGPLFGVQFSQLPCSDLAARFPGTASPDALIGPKRSPLGLSADPGGFPLYKDGVLVGGIGVSADPDYAFDPDILDTDADIDEQIALAGTLGFAAPEAIRADRIYVDGTQLRYSDAAYASLFNVTGATYAQTDPALGAMLAVRGYFSANAPLAGTAYGTEASGVRQATTAEFADRDAFILTDGSGANRFPIRAGTDGADIAQPITAAEARALLEEAFQIMTRARAQIRQPLDSRAQVTISLVDTRGQVLGVVRAPDAPIFGTDVSLQKARTAAFFSGAHAGPDLLADPSADVRGFVGKLRTFLNDPAALTGAFAFADRSGGNLSRPYFPDGEVGNPPGPLSRPIEQFNPFSTGLQSALVFANLGQHLAYVLGQSNADTPRRCTALPEVAPGQSRLQNGIQIFPGSVPIYRGGTLIGGLGVSGDGIDQDDMISFLGAHNAGARLGTLGNAPAEIRADTIVVNVGGKPVRLRYVSCPFAPFLDSAAQNVCQGL